MRSIFRAVAATLVLGVCTSGAVAEDASDVEAMQREVADLREQVAGLREAMSEIAEHAKRTTEILNTVLSTAPAPTAAKPASEPPALPVTAKATPALPPVARAAKLPRKEQAPAQAGVVEGKVRVPSSEPVAFVYVENVPASLVRERVSIDQKDKRFTPAWAVVRSGTTISFPNNDNIYHNVFSLSTGNTFDLGLYNASSSAKTHTFYSPGVVDIYCNIHPQMAASVLVVPSQLFAKVRPDGTFTIKNVPKGQRKIVAWAPGSKLASEWIEVGEGAAQIALALEPKSRAHKNKHGRAYGSYE